MNKIMFNERYGLQSAVFEGRKTQTRREPFYSESVCCEFNRQGKLECFTHDDVSEYLIHTSRYSKGEIVAIAQSYSEIADEMKDAICAEEFGKFYVKPFIDTKGWNNKMFVRADLMPHHIKITDIRCERLQEISEDDSVCEGIYMRFNEKENRLCWCYNDSVSFCNPQFAFRMLIGKINGNKFWDTKPYVIVYEFENID